MLVARYWIFKKGMILILYSTQYLVSYYTKVSAKDNLIFDSDLSGLGS